MPESEHLLAEPLLTDLLGRLEGWQREGEAITKTYTLSGFTTAMAFANRVAEAATAADHHPDIHIERYKRVDQTTMSVQLVIQDPKAYTATWVGDTKSYKLLTGKKAYMEELFCIPEEEDSFTNRIRMPAVGQKPN